ncbi:MarR family winged helix-turn-helix transcriptional regulator [Paenibacillus nasutitermitis]|uniref:Transcriptional regulator n=1 Tax=Paenibacillus nasutitermitis TaxID=1652958 RepID=A0A917E0Z1_9BACL|nr:MarR family winged helix-turn-helix transcriptional regulator [Paenibacillus nasutitermitis]GGD93042.1 transcriptional regulator [Paenibacillus nasutitermitis]
MPKEHSLPSELFRVLRQIRHLNWKGQKPIEGCTQSESVMLFIINRMGKVEPAGMKASELSQLLKVTSPTVTQSVNVLEARGLLERSPDPGDRRVVRIKLTEEGLRQTQLSVASMFEGFQELISHIGEERIQQLIELLDDIFEYSNGYSAPSFCQEFKPNLPNEGET